jgi:hypothetical protein
MADINGGQKILLRLRPAHAPDTFYEEEQIVLVMLHEVRSPHSDSSTYLIVIQLTHNVHGPHDEKFYKYLSGLEDEYDALKRSGYAGEGFFSKGHRLGVNVSHDLPPYLARVKALEAAEKRRRIGGIMSSGGKLGGKNMAGMSPRELAAQVRFPSVYYLKYPNHMSIHAGCRTQGNGQSSLWFWCHGTT